jgi:uncharacterized protein (DUF58 family)
MSSLDYLDPRTLASIGPLQLRARMVVEGVMTGMHRSPHLGTSVEFAQHRPYSPGDDIRRLDWKVFGRTDKLYVKQYQQETNLDLLLLVDVSGSMAFASNPANRAGGASDKTPAWSKFDHAASLTAALAYLALHQQDRVGLTLFSDRVVTAVRPSNARDHWRTLIDAIASHAPPAMAVQERATDRAHKPVAVPSNGGAAGDTPPAPHMDDPETDLAMLFDQLSAKLTQRSLIVLISDLFDDPASLERGLARLSHRGHDLVLMQVLDPAELHFPLRDASEFIGLETGDRLKLDPPALREAYLAAMNEHLQRVQACARQFRYDYQLLDTSTHLAAPLSQYLARRSAMMSKGK